MDTPSTSAMRPHGSGRFCWRCADPLPGLPPVICGSCGQAHFANPKPAGEAVVERLGRVLLIRRAVSPWRDHWDLPGGFCEAAEHPRTAAERELLEETGLTGRASAFVGMWIDNYDQPTPDGHQTVTLNAVYLTTLIGNDAPSALAHEVFEIGWFDFDALPANLAFPRHLPAALAAARRLLRVDGGTPPMLDAG